MSIKPAVTVVSSHVVRGAVGGSANAFILERMGFPVSFLPTVILPWHPGQGRSTRVKLEPQEFAGAVADLAASPTGDVVATLTGYFGNDGQIDAAAMLVRAVKARNPGTIFLCDPIIGDAGGLFQPPDLAAAIRERLLPLADIATPNRHELMWLEGEVVNDNDGLVRLARRLGPAEVVVTSAFAPDGETGVLLVTADTAVLARHAALDGAPNGTGDVFAALYLGHTLDGAAPAAALARATAGTFAAVTAAVRDGLDALPLAAEQERIVSAEDGVTVVRV